MLEIIGVPFDLCGRRRGSALGPAAVRQAGLEDTLVGMGLDVVDGGDVSCSARDAAGPGIRNFEAAARMLSHLKARTLAALHAGSMPLVIGGDHSISIGSVSAALEHEGPGLAVLWIDAHADINTPVTSHSGNLHGMPLAALLGQEVSDAGPSLEQWSRLLGEVVPRQRLKPERLGWIGLRDVDEHERQAIASLRGSFATTMQDVDRFGVERVLRGFDKWIRNSGASSLWISFDVDVLDPILAPGTGTAVRGGLSYREAHLVAELLHEQLSSPDCPTKLLGLDLVETNPLVDTTNETARVAAEWIGSLFGKSILGLRPPVDL